ncbi:hypothetical protein KOW79_000025 [Hemibagrus wyckioides]|uniref:SAM domain-containing protein n=1 Tax=Hemibagrus wyckioides TaxID=337641 RepID=A0A9D3N0R5_9TELE|nr:hypothetical protein KOW79_000025 [Hemibagrus wyckioides]
MRHPVRRGLVAQGRDVFISGFMCLDLKQKEYTDKREEMELHSTPVEKWTEDMVSLWLASIGVKENYIKTLHEQEVDGQVLLTIKEEFLKKRLE